MSNIGKTMKASLGDIIYTSAKLENYSLVDTLNWMDSVIPISIKDIDSDTCGFYFAASDAGAVTAINFWKEALEKNVSFANPRNFPATLSNFVAASLSAKMQIRGPNINIVGNEDVLPQLFFHALVDIQKNGINKAVIAFIPSFTQENNEVNILWVMINKDEGEHIIELSRANQEIITPEANQSLYEMLKQYVLQDTFTFYGGAGIPQIKFARKSN